MVTIMMADNSNETPDTMVSWPWSTIDYRQVALRTQRPLLSWIVWNPAHGMDMDVRSGDSDEVALALQYVPE